MFQKKKNTRIPTTYLRIKNSKKAIILPPTLFALSPNFWYIVGTCKRNEWGLAMFEAVQAIIGLRAKPRETEQAEARFEKRRKSGILVAQDRHDSESLPAFFIRTEDESAVSVNAALLFLEGFLESRLDKITRHTNTKNSSWVPDTTSNQNTNAATKAYRHASELSGPATRNKSSENQDEHSSDDLKRIYHLINDLRSLAERGVDSVKIVSDASFLDALSDAIAIANAS